MYADSSFYFMNLFTFDDCDKQFIPFILINEWMCQQSIKSAINQFNWFWMLNGIINSDNGRMKNGLCGCSHMTHWMIPLMNCDEMKFVLFLLLMPQAALTPLCLPSIYLPLNLFQTFNLSGLWLAPWLNKFNGLK